MNTKERIGEFVSKHYYISTMLFMVTFLSIFGLVIWGAISLWGKEISYLLTLFEVNFLNNNIIFFRSIGVIIGVGIVLLYRHSWKQAGKDGKIPLYRLFQVCICFFTVVPLFIVESANIMIALVFFIICSFFFLEKGKGIFLIHSLINRVKITRHS